jgi:60 kDa SS-A/Ro ribonucleoprotein
MVTAATEPNYQIVCFTDGAGQPKLELAGEHDPVGARHQPAPTARRHLPLHRAAADGWHRLCPADGVGAAEPCCVRRVRIVTDNETWYGPIHPHQALREYREKMNPQARLVVVSMTGTLNSITDPADPLSLEVSGFDSAVPQVIADFARGDL